MPDLTPHTAGQIRRIQGQDARYTRLELGGHWQASGVCRNAQAQRLAARRGPPELRDSTNLPPRRTEPTAAARSAPPAPIGSDRAADGPADGTTRSTSRARRASPTSACRSSCCTMRRRVRVRGAGRLLEAGCAWFDHSPSTPGLSWTSVSSWCASQQLGTTSARARAPHSASTACAQLYQQERIGEGTAERHRKIGPPHKEPGGILEAAR